jgi:hypothetical protein
LQNLGPAVLVEEYRFHRTLRTRSRWMNMMSSSSRNSPKKIHKSLLTYHPNLGGR